MKSYKDDLIQIYNADAYDLIKTIPDKSVDLVYIDIPYLIESGGVSSSALSKRIHRIKDTLEGNQEKIKALQDKANELYEKMQNATDKSEYEKWHSQRGSILNKINLISTQDISKGIDYSIFDELVRVMKYIYIFIWCSKEQINDIMKIFIDKYNCRFNLLVWCKTNCVPATNDMWLPNVEYCLVFKEKGAKRYNDGYDLKSKWYLSGTNKADKDLYDHPTIKPYQFVKQHILHSTNEGDTVLDCFMGSGTTGVVCRETNRKFIGCEINDVYYQIAEDRIKGLSQVDKRKIEEGQMQLEL